jgi:hypothetical protein
MYRLGRMQTFARFEDFVATHPLEGLGTDMATLRRRSPARLAMGGIEIAPLPLLVVNGAVRTTSRRASPATAPACWSG